MSNKKAMKKEINFYARYLYDPQKEERRNKLLVYCLPILALIVAMGSVFAFFKISTAIDRNEIEECNEYISSPGNIASYRESEELQVERDALIQQYSGLDAILKNIESYPRMNSSFLGQVNRAIGSSADIMSVTYDSANGILIIGVETPSANNMPPVVESVRKTGLFEAVSYTGYSLEDDTYAANIACIVENR